MIEDTNKRFFRDYDTSVLISFVLVVILITHSGCKFFQLKKSNSSDTTSVKKDVTEQAKVDTSKSKSESEYKKETFYFGRDTTINNFYPASPTVYIKESGSKKDETNNYQFENFRKELLDSINANKKVVSVETKGKFGFSTFEIIVLCTLGLYVIKTFANPLGNLLTKIK